MVKTTNENAKDYVNQKISFRGNNTFGEYDNNGTYKVYSYGYHFPIYAYKGGTWYKNKGTYSVTTSKHKNQLRPKGINSIELTTQELQDL
jgi:hypothetical protein